MLFPLDGLPGRLALAEQDNDTFIARAKFLRTNPELRARLMRCYEDAQPEGNDATHIESRLYEGFFSEEDTKKMGQFHQLPWKDRYFLVQSFDDERLKELGTRIIYFENKHLLSHDDCRRLDVLFAERITSSGDNLPWTTLPVATQEWAELAAGDMSELADGHKQYIKYLWEWAVGVLNVAAAA
jgi:exodeoxyribonuclease-1